MIQIILTVLMIPIIYLLIGFIIATIAYKYKLPDIEFPGDSNYNQQQFLVEDEEDFISCTFLWFIIPFILVSSWKQKYLSKEKIKASVQNYMNWLR